MGLSNRKTREKHWKTSKDSEINKTSWPHSIIDNALLSHYHVMLHDSHITVLCVVICHVMRYDLLENTVNFRCDACLKVRRFRLPIHCELAEK